MSLKCGKFICAHFITTFQVFGDIRALKIIPSEVITAIEQHISEMDTVLGDSFDTNSRERRRVH
jgi:hypothetical protein